MILLGLLPGVPFAIFWWLWRGRALRYEAALEEIAENNCRWCCSEVAKETLERR